MSPTDFSAMISRRLPLSFSGSDPVHQEVMHSNESQGKGEPQQLAQAEIFL